LREDAAEAEHGAEDDSSEEESSDEEAAPVYCYRNNRQQYR
jgi:hypothetical protein